MALRRCGTRPVNLLSRRSWLKRGTCWSRSLIPAWDCLPATQTRSLTHSLQPSLRAQVWDWRSPAPLSSRMVAAYGPPRTSDEGQRFSLRYPAHWQWPHDLLDTPTVFIIDDDARMRAAMQHLL